MTAALMISAVEKDEEYPAFSRSGRRGPPMATTVAWVEPETAPKSVQAVVVAMESRSKTGRPRRLYEIRL